MFYLIFKKLLSNFCIVCIVILGSIRVNTENHWSPSHSAILSLRKNLGVKGVGHRTSVAMKGHLKFFKATMCLRYSFSTALHPSGHLPITYSRIRFHPITNATNSPTHT